MKTDEDSNLGKQLKILDKNETAGVDRISELPEHIIHSIMALLPTKDVTRISMLSKSMRSVWSSFPIIDFDSSLFGDFDSSLFDSSLFSDFDSSLFSKKSCMRKELFLNYVHDSVRRRNPKMVIQKFRLQVGVGFELDHRIDGAISFVVEHGAKELEIDLYISNPGRPRKVPSAKSITWLDLNDLIRCPMIENMSLSYCNGLKDVKILSSKIKTVDLQYCAGLMNIEIESPSLQYFKYIGKSEPCQIKVANWEFLKTLSLQDVTITDNWVEDHVSELVWLENLELSGCKMLKNAKIWNANLKKIGLRGCSGLESIEIGVVDLQSFVYINGTSKSCKINIGACKYLKNLSLKGPNITDELLKDHVSKLLQLENLTLEECHTLEMVEIVHEDLKSLHLLDCNKLVEVKVDTPKLVSFMYKGKVVRFPLLNSNVVLDATLSIKTSSRNDGYFVMLRNLLGLFGHCKYLTLICSSDEDLIFPEKQRNSLLPPLYDLKHLKIKVSYMFRNFTELMDSLLWLSPLPETLSFVSNTEEKSIKLQYGKMVAKEENPFCCRDQPIKCWRHCLKSVEMENFEGVHDRDILLKYFRENAKLLENIDYK